MGDVTDFTSHIEMKGPKGRHISSHDCTYIHALLRPI